MGYEVHITRKALWFDEDGPSIGLDEWLACIAADASMRHDGFAEAPLADGASIRVEAEGLAVWTGYSGHGVDGNMAWFSWFDGRITVNKPDEEILEKMIALAEALDAEVQGDEGELYPLVAEAEAEAETQARVPSAPRAEKPWWRFW